VSTKEKALILALIVVVGLGLAILLGSPSTRPAPIIDLHPPTSQSAPIPYTPAPNKKHVEPAGRTPPGSVQNAPGQVRMEILSSQVQDEGMALGEVLVIQAILHSKNGRFASRVTMKCLVFYSTTTCGALPPGKVLTFKVKEVRTRESSLDILSTFQNGRELRYWTGPVIMTLYGAN